MKQWICSDLHFGHKNIIVYEPTRLTLILEYIEKHKLTFEGLDFSLTTESVNAPALMDAYQSNEDFRHFMLAAHDNLLIENWNNQVAKDDFVYFLGDFTLTRSKETINSLCQKLHGRKVLVMGNHDTRKPVDYIEAGFEQVTKRPIVLPRNKCNVMLMHEPPIDETLDNSLDRRGIELTTEEIATLDNTIRWNPYDKFLFGHVHSNIAPIEIHSNVKCVCLDRNNLQLFDLDKIVKDLCNPK